MASLPGSQTEYHHFIPQFILRNFSHKYSPSSSGAKSKSARRRKNKKTNLYPGDPALNIIDLKNETPEISEVPVKRTFGLPDMYRDISCASDQYYLEKEIGKLECRVSAIIASIKKASESCQSGISMSRNDRDVLRKFLFIMKYRGKGFRRRFRGGESGDYTEEDEDQVKKYMQEKGFKRPVDVWFKSIKTILELKMDLEGKWKSNLVAQIYPEDAMWFIMHTEWYFLAFCTPSHPNDEYILTENCYNVFEGPNSTMLNPDTGEYEAAAWTSYHEFSPITPKLMLVLRSVLLPNLQEDIREDIKKWREELYEANTRSHSSPTGANSILADLPITKPRNSYSQVTAEGTQLLPNEDGSRRSYHRFTFSFFKISTDHVRKINCVLLENAHSTSTIAFNHQSSLKNTLEHYIQLPADGGFKSINCQEGNVRLTFLRKLESVVRLLGSTVNLTCQTIPATDFKDDPKIKKKALKQFRKYAIGHLPEEPTEFMQLYEKLGGSRETMIMDKDQVRKMRFLRIKIDVCTQGFVEAIRQEIRDNLGDIFCQLPPRRVWMYLKEIRVMRLCSPEDPDMSLASNELMDGPEDVIANVSHLVRPECLGRLLHFTVMQGLEHRLYPGLSPSSEITPDEAGLVRFQKITHLTFASGNICDCGIESIEKAAIMAETMLRATKFYERFRNPVWTDDETIEVLTRSFVRKEMDSLFSEKLPEDTLQELMDVLFNVVYPSYKKRPTI